MSRHTCVVERSTTILVVDDDRAIRDALQMAMACEGHDVLTAVDGLDAGADDYLPKPFDQAELLARIRALLRRVRPGDAGVPLRLDDLALDPVRSVATRGDSDLDLTTTEFDLLRVLMLHAGQVLSRSTIYAEIWGSGVPTTSRSLDVYVSYLRAKTEARGVRCVRSTPFVGRASRCSSRRERTGRAGRACRASLDGHRPPASADRQAALRHSHLHGQRWMSASVRCRVH